MNFGLIKRIVAAGVACLMLTGIAACGGSSSEGQKLFTSAQSKSVQSGTNGRSSTPSGEPGMVIGDVDHRSVTLNSDSSSPYNWAGWDIQKVKRVDSNQLDITLKNKSKQSFNADISEFIEFKALKGDEEMAGVIIPRGFVGDSSLACRDSSGNDLDAISPGQTAVCRFEYYLDYVDMPSISDATAVRPFDLMRVDVCSGGDLSSTDMCRRVYPVKTYQIEG